jgi:hypothetical protein
VKANRRPIVAVAVGVLLASAACSRKETAKPAQTQAADPAARKPGASAAHVSMPRDGTLAVVKGTLEAGKDAEFVVSEEKGALLIVQVVGQDRDPGFSVHRADTGAYLPDDHPKNVAHWIERVPETLGYLIVVHATDQPTGFTLSIEAPRELQVDDKTRSAEVSFTAPAHASVAYLVPPGPAIKAELRAAPKGAVLTAEALDTGERLLKAAAGARSFTGAPAESGDSIVLRVHQGDEAGDITLRVERQ